jgi:DNA-binding NarL/FixJ family response regulator
VEIQLVPTTQAVFSAGIYKMNGEHFKSGSKGRIMVVDDHPLVREGLIQIINRQNDLVCCGEAESAVEAQETVGVLHPDLVTIDIRLQNGDGLELMKRLSSGQPSPHLLVISQCDEAIYAERALKAGARGYVMKERATTEVLTAIRTILAGGLYVSPKVATLALQKVVEGKTASSSGGVDNLSNRELQVLQLLGAGLSTRKAAARLGLSVKTIETHRENIKHKLGLLDGVELIRYATDLINGQSSQISFEPMNPSEQLEA